MQKLVELLNYITLLLGNEEVSTKIVEAEEFESGQRNAHILATTRACTSRYSFLGSEGASERKKQKTILFLEHSPFLATSSQACSSNQLSLIKPASRTSLA
jgi:hypothetical protein